jgi:hypothetical protein
MQEIVVAQKEGYRTEGTLRNEGRVGENWIEIKRQQKKGKLKKMIFFIVYPFYFVIKFANISSLKDSNCDSKYRNIRAVYA